MTIILVGHTISKLCKITYLERTCKLNRKKFRYSLQPYTEGAREILIKEGIYLTDLSDSQDSGVTHYDSEIQYLESSSEIINSVLATLNLQVTQFP